MDEAERCHRLAYIFEGRLLAEGTVDEVVRQARLTTWSVSGPRLLTLAERLRVVGLVRDHDPDDPVCRRAAELGVPVSADVTLRGIERLIDRLGPDCVVVSSYNRVLPARLVGKTRFVNVHYALLPRYRGRANVNWAVINGERETGISIHVLAPGLDAGNVLFQQAVPIGPADTVTDLYERLNALQREHLGAVVLRHLAGDDGFLSRERVQR